MVKSIFILVVFLLSLAVVPAAWSQNSAASTSSAPANRLGIGWDDGFSLRLNVDPKLAVSGILSRLSLINSNFNFLLSGQISGLLRSGEYWRLSAFGRLGFGRTGYDLVLPIQLGVMPEFYVLPNVSVGFRAGLEFVFDITASDIMLQLFGHPASYLNLHLYFE